MPIPVLETPSVGDLQKRCDLVDETEFALLRGVKVSALRNERSRNQGPPFVPVGRKIYYPFTGVKAYLEARTVRPATTPTLIHGNRRRRSVGAK
jgi:hypothetical protein